MIALLTATAFLYATSYHRLMVFSELSRPNVAEEGLASSVSDKHFVVRLNSQSDVR